MNAIPQTCEERPLSAKTEAALSCVPLTGQVRKDASSMTYPAFSATLSPDMAARTAQAWYEQAASMAATAVAVSDTAASLAKAADELLNVATGAPLPARQSMPLTQGDNVVYVDFRARRKAVTR